MLKKTILSAGLIAGLAVTGSGVPSNGADELQIGNGLTYSGATGSDPVSIGFGTDFGITFNENSSGNITNQILLALLIPNNGGVGANTPYFKSDPVTAITAYGSYPGTANLNTSSAFTGTGFSLGTGSASYGSDGYWGEITGASTKLSSFLGAGFSNSNGMSNFVAFDAALGLSTSDFGVYTILATTGPVSSSGFIDVQAGGLPIGSIVAVVTDTGYTVPWTKAGGINGTVVVAGGPLPIPATLPLVGAGMLGLGLLALRNRRRSTSKP